MTASDQMTGSDVTHRPTGGQGSEGRTAAGAPRLTDAELRRLLAPGGARGWLVVACLATLLGSGLYVMLERDVAVRRSLPWTIGGLVYTAPMLALMVISMAIMSRVPDDRGNGLLFTAFARVPRHADVFWARLRSWVLIGLVLSLGVTAVSLLAGLLLVGVPEGSASDWMLSLLCANLTMVTSLVLVFAVSSCLRRGAGVVAVCAGIFLVAPMAILIAQDFVPFAFVRSLLSHLMTVLPGNLLVLALGTPSPHGSWTPTLRALAGLVAWAVVGTLFARSRFLREDYIRD